MIEFFMDSQTLFNSWLTSKSLNRHDPLSPTGSKSYAAIWISWCRWLTEPDENSGNTRVVSYLDARPSDLATFLMHGPTPRSSRRAQRPLSEITRRRYWRVIHSLYDHALMHLLVPSNPADGLIGNDMPPPENAIGQVFNSRQLKAINDAFPLSEGKWDVRDRAMLVLLMDEALTVAELCSLEVKHVGRSLIDPARLTLLVSGKRKAQERIMDLGQRAGLAITQWLAYRATMVCIESDEPLFLTERCRRASPRVVFHLVASTVTRGLNTAGLELPMHIGPQVLRNTCIVNWINSGKYLTGVLIKVGLKDVKSLKGLLSHITANLPQVDPCPSPRKPGR